MAFNMAHFLDTVLTLIALVVPVYLVVRLNLIGVVVGALWFWLTLVMAGELLSALDPERSRLLDAFWLQAGWLAGLFYGALIYGAKKLSSFWRAKRRPAI